ncbi:conserved hypothetical protein [Shewanella sediminis HAW-EB3]|uniref:Uncharacterized protein n=1 Tax=Shewanella sediminis (strain HAW-EB3) TaxID=425104 RepID=A8FRK2_SHESH|nr:hypothetical protein [Shewanella sediminis]ABV35475.1 conserved hypothetical protein [Shewanella sediminis HAW-EB3]
MKTLKVMHWVGLFMFIIGVLAYLFTDMALVISGMVLVSSLIGLGLVMMSPFPIVIFIQWAREQDKKRDEPI